jgi:hypothetical protein
MTPKDLPNDNEALAREQAASRLAAAERELREAQAALNSQPTEANRARYARAVAEERAASEHVQQMLTRLRGA